MGRWVSIRGLIGGAVAAVLALLVPLGALPGSAAESGAVAKLALAAVAFVIGYLIADRLGRRRPQFDVADDGDALEARLARIEAALVALPSQTTKAIKACPSADLDRTLRSIQRALRKPHSDPVLLEAVQSLQSDGPAAILARVEALETRLTEGLATLDARLALMNIGSSGEPPLALDRLPARRPSGLAPDRIGRAVADIRRSIDGVAH